MKRSNIGFDSGKNREIKNQNQSVKKKKRKKWILIILIVFLFVMLTIGVGSYVLIKYLANKAEENVEEKMGSVSNSEWQSEWKKIEEAKEEIKGKNIEEERGREGDILSDGEISISLSLVERKGKIGEDVAREGYEFVILRMNIMNQKTEDVYFYGTNFILRDSRYTEYNMKTIDTSEYNLIKGMQNIPGEGWIDRQAIYEVRENIGNLEFVYMGEKKLIFEIN